ncbi:malto-oligosyltrehalose synthase [Endobacterium cereale]|uniref:malto-oligosyltrehalose synthase n=1 Tax=Endobacterium cereale TaxID=2663029 RepID=UPI002B4936EE|nr:malto-oligosyltrehalose synthase [Endobacterium cereale]MEB2845839.1 malto-oligosyltrehalose synthase [Endobacterium cereale]
MAFPTSTYRLQFRNGMTFDRAIELVPYLKKLGISHLYASPIFTATSGSTHGYDVTNANEIDPTIGGREGFDKLSATLKKADLGLILDIVPNHMAASLENPWWRSIIEWGEDSLYASHFDVDWTRSLTLPFLGDDFDAVISDLSITADAQAGCLALTYYDSRYPLNPKTYASVLDGIDLPIAKKIATIAAHASPWDANAFHDGIRAALSTGTDAGFSPADTMALASALEKFSNDPNNLLKIRDLQPWRLTSWRTAANNLSYRRFFEITGLAGLRVEEESVFDDAHRLVLELVRGGIVDGLRIDHVDGLADPKTYLDKLRSKIGPDTFLIIEKILGEGETVAADWPIAGTTGYEFISELTDVMIDNAGLKTLYHAYDRLRGRPTHVTSEVRDAKGLMFDVNFAGEVSTLLRLATDIRAAEGGDMIAPETVRTALREILLTFPVYRTYGTADGLPEADRKLLTEVLETVREGGRAEAEALAFIERLITGDVAKIVSDKATTFRIRLQQLSGPLTAKSIEDTLFFRINPLLALNEVGSEPFMRDHDLKHFHAAMQARRETQPNGLSCSSTHDTKRGEDARARLLALTEAPDVFAEAVNRWRGLNAAAIHSLPDGAAPEPALEWMLYQALAGVWPPELTIKDADGIAALSNRFLTFVEKALREAKLHTNWGEPNEAYETAVADYVHALFGNRIFLSDFVATMQPFWWAGAVNGITQTLIKLTAPGIPDIYQGSETLDLSLVDPDNRREPDFETLAKQLSAATHLPVTDEDWLNGAVKQQVIARALRLRQDKPTLFSQGRYIPLTGAGKRGRNVISFARADEQDAVLLIAPRLVLGAFAEHPSTAALDGWDETSLTLQPGLADRRYRDLFSGRVIAAGEKLSVAEALSGQHFTLLVAEG